MAGPRVQVARTSKRTVELKYIVMQACNFISGDDRALTESPPLERQRCCPRQQDGSVDHVLQGFYRCDTTTIVQDVPYLQASSLQLHLYYCNNMVP